MPTMNKLMHDIINKFNAINLMCGTMALEMESVSAQQTANPLLKEKLLSLLGNVESDLVKARGMLQSIATSISGELNCYKENEHFFKVVEPGIETIEAKSNQLKQVVSEEGAGMGNVCWESGVISTLHAIEEKALACGIVLKELRSNLISLGKYNNGVE